MDINKKLEADVLVMEITGRLDTVTSPQLQSEVDALSPMPAKLVLDFSHLDYISSAGLRVLLVANKKMVAAGGTLEVAGANASVREIFDMTGFSDIFTLV